MYLLCKLFLSRDLCAYINVTLVGRALFLHYTERSGKEKKLKQRFAALLGVCESGTRSSNSTGKRLHRECLLTYHFPGLAWDVT